MERPELEARIDFQEAKTRGGGIAFPRSIGSMLVQLYIQLSPLVLPKSIAGSDNLYSILGTSSTPYLAIVSDNPREFKGAYRSRRAGKLPASR